MQPITLDPSISAEFEGGMKLSGTIELPFPTAYVWVTNGQASNKSLAKIAPVLYYGGFSANKDDIDVLINQFGLPVPNEFIETTIATRNGDEFNAYTAREIYVAPIDYRESWLDADSKLRRPDFADGYRRHFQALVYLFTREGEQTFIPWHPVVLSAKGFQARNLRDSFAAWQKATATARSVAAPNIKAWFFILKLGTFGDERKAVLVGQEGAKSPITPISPFIPKNVTPELVANLFVGQEVAALMADYKRQSQEWLRAWDEAYDEAALQEAFEADREASAAIHAETPSDFDYPPPPPAFMQGEKVSPANYSKADEEEGIPF